MRLLEDVAGSGRIRGVSPLTMAILALLAYRSAPGKTRLAEMLGRTADGTIHARSTHGLGDWLGSLLESAAAGGILSVGLGDLMKSFQQSGQGAKAASWVAKGANSPISPPDLAQALGPERIVWLMRETGTSPNELLTGLSQELPQVVDGLTPEGRLPTAEEAARMALLIRSSLPRRRTEPDTTALMRREGAVLQEELAR